MKNCFKLMILLAIAILQASCGSTITCPNLKESVVESALAWTPYEKNDTIIFGNKIINSLVRLTINEVKVEHTTEYKFGTKCGGCSDQIRVLGKINGTAFDIYTEIEKNRIISQQFHFPFSYFSSFSEYPTYTVEDVEYENVRIYHSGNTNNGYKTLITAKGIGIVGFIDCDDNLWTTSNTIVVDKAKNVSITNTTGC